MNVAHTILNQLGGNRFLAMTGAKNLLGRPDGLSFKVGTNAKKVSHVRITITPADLYTVEFMQVRGTQVPKILHTAVQVYADHLQELFTRHTGLDTRL
jgi:hypothetical protein